MRSLSKPAPRATERLGHERLKFLAEAFFEKINDPAIGDIHPRGSQDELDRTSATRFEKIRPRERLRHHLDAIQILIVWCAESDDDVSQLAGTDATHFSYTSPAIDQYNVGEFRIGQLASHPLEVGFALVFLVKLRPIKGLHCFRIMAEVISGARSSGKQKEAALGAAIAGWEFDRHEDVGERGEDILQARRTRSS